MLAPAADRRMKTSTMLLLNFILHPSQQSLQVCLLQIRYAYSTKGCWIPLAFIYEQANFWWLVGRTKYVIGSPPSPVRPATGPHTLPTMHVIAEKGLFMYSTSQLCSSSASRIMDLINKLIWAIRPRRVCAHRQLPLDSQIWMSTSRPASHGVDDPTSLWFEYSKFIFTCVENVLKLCKVSAGAFWSARDCDFAMVRSVQIFRPARSPPSQSIMISSPALLWQSS